MNKRFGGPCWTLSDHAVQVSALARGLGTYERSLQVLDEIEEREMNPFELRKALDERVCVLRAMDPPRLAEAMDAARRAARLADEIQESRSRLSGYGERADVAIAVQSFSEAGDALRVVREVALGDETLDRAYLLLRARYRFQKERDALSGNDDEAARKLYRMLAEWPSEIEEALEALEE